jgi:hypothetical protein
MVNESFDLPVWGPGHFNETNGSYIDFTLSGPLTERSPGLDNQMAIDRAADLIGRREWAEAVHFLERVPDSPSKRPLLVKGLTELADDRETIRCLWPPTTDAEAVILGSAILEAGRDTEAKDFLQLRLVTESNDASVREIARRVRERWSR